MLVLHLKELVFDLAKIMKAPNDPRPTWRNGVIQIHITRACDLACTGCTQGSNLGGKPVIMSLENFEIAVKSLIGYQGVIGIFGGNPTTHPKFGEICEILARWIPKEQAGLWSNNLNGYGALCRATFNPNYSNLNVHTDRAAYDEMKQDWPECQPKGMEDSRHSPPYVAMKDMEDLTETQMRDLIENCDVNQLWSAMVCEFRGQPRAFFCELAGAQSMLHQHEPDYPDTGLYVTPGWWQLSIDWFEGQINKHCFECGIPLKLKGDLAHTGTKEYVSKTHLNIYKTKKKRDVELVTKTSQLPTVTRATDYIENGAQKMSVLIGVPTLEMARNASFYDYFNMMEKPDGTGMTFAHGQSPARNRNLIIEQALQNNFSHVLFLDDDIAFPPNLLKKLLSHDKDMVTALYYMRNYPHHPILFNSTNERGECLHHFLQPGQSGLIEVVAAGLGAVLIKTDVFRKMEKPWIRLGELEKDHWCDDLGFYRRARELGFKLYADLDMGVGHMASVIVWPNKKGDNWVTTYESYGVEGPSVKQKLNFYDSMEK